MKLYAHTREERESVSVCILLSSGVRTRLLPDTGLVGPAADAVVEVEVVLVGEVAVFRASAPLSLEPEFLRLGSRTSLPDWNMKRRSCHGGEDMAMAGGQ